jgi:integrase
LQSYIDKAEKETRSGNTGSDVKRIERFLEPHFHQNISILEMPSVAEELVQQVRLDAEERELKPVSLRNNLTKLNQFVNWLKRKDVKLLSYETPNEFEGLIKVEVPLGDAPYILTPLEMKEIIETARLTNDRCHLLPFFILHCFLGCRPSELIGMTWDNVKVDDTDEPFVLIPQRKTGKNKRPRRVVLTDFPAVVEWLCVCDRSKPFFPYKKDKNDKMERNFYDKRRIVLAEAVVLPLEATIEESKKYDDCGRHSCATYLYAGKWDAKTIADRLGNTTKVLLNHYIENDKSKSEAVEYFSISPSKSDQKLVKFAG